MTSVSERRPLMVQEFAEKASAGFAGLYIHSAEPSLAIEQLCAECERQKWSLLSWDVHRGLLFWNSTRHTMVPHPNQEGQQIIQAPAAIDSLWSSVEINPEYGAESPNDPRCRLLVLVNGHRWLDGPLFQRLINHVHEGKGARKIVAVLSPIIKLPPEYEAMKILDIIEHPLPGREALKGIAESIATEGEMPVGDDLEKLLDCGAGMTGLSFENSCALAIYRRPRKVINPHEILEAKQQILKTTQGLTLYAGKETFADVGGLDFLKQYLKQVLGQRHINPKFCCRGVLLMGVSGGGKSLVIKALGNEMDRPVLVFDVGATRGSLLGQSEGQFRKVLATAEALSPSVLMIDEVEKALSGVAGSARTDGGVGAATFGYFLSWMQDHIADVMCCCSCNDIRKLSDDNPELIRRFDELFFIDFPNRQAKDAIWQIHLRGYELWDGQSDFAAVELPCDDRWTGADIERCCRQARLRGLPVAQVGQHLTKIADQAKDTIEAARQWASGKCYAAEYEGIYVPEEHARRMRENGAVKRRIGRGV